MTEEIISVNKEAAKRKARRAGKRAAGFVSQRVASTGRAAKEKVGQARQRAVRVVSKRVASTGNAVMRRASTAHRAAAARFLDAAIEISRKQQAVLEKLKTRL